MKPTFLAAAAVLALGSLPAAAQDVVEISPDDSVLVERYVRAIPEPPPVIVEHMTLRPGSVIPGGVRLEPFAGNPRLARYAYFVSVDHKIVVATPARGSWCVFWTSTAEGRTRKRAAEAARP